jgi:hypothetical protein
VPRQAEESWVVYRPTAPRRQGGLSLSAQQLWLFELMHPASRASRDPRGGSCWLLGQHAPESNALQPIGREPSPGRGRSAKHLVRVPGQSGRLPAPLVASMPWPSLVSL